MSTAATSKTQAITYHYTEPVAPQNYEVAITDVMTEVGGQNETLSCRLQQVCCHKQSSPRCNPNQLSSLIIQVNQVIDIFVFTLRSNFPL
jgi:hypothetical protein